MAPAGPVATRMSPIWKSLTWNAAFRLSMACD